MKATTKQQRQLLDLQQADLKVSRLQHQMAKHPVREKLAELKGRAEDLQRYAVGLGAEIDDRRRELASVEDEIAKVRTRREVQQERLDSGKVGIRDMSAVEHEIERIQVRQDELEGVLLQQMEELEACETRLAEAQAQTTVLAEDEAATIAALDEALAEPKAEVEKIAAVRAELRAELPEQIVAEYDRLRERQGPVVVLHLEDRMLVNSPVMVAADQLDQATEAPADELWEDQETGYLIARPA